MAIRVVCSKCKTPHIVPESDSWQVVRCDCGTRIPIPSSVRLPDNPAPSRNIHSAPARSGKGFTVVQMLRESIPVRIAVAALRRVAGNAPTGLAFLIVTVALVSIYAAWRVVVETSQIFELYGGTGSFSDSAHDSDLGAMVIVFLIGLYFFIAQAAPLVVVYFLRLGRYWARLVMYLILAYDLVRHSIVMFHRVTIPEFLVSAAHIILSAAFIYILSQPAARDFCDQNGVDCSERIR